MPYPSLNLPELPAEVRIYTPPMTILNTAKAANKPNAKLNISLIKINISHIVQSLLTPHFTSPLSDPELPLNVEEPSVPLAGVVVPPLVVLGDAGLVGEEGVLPPPVDCANRLIGNNKLIIIPNIITLFLITILILKNYPPTLVFVPVLVS